MTLLLMLLLKSLLVFAVAGAALFALCRASAAARHLVCLLTLASLLALPLFSLALPGWHVPVLEARVPPPTPNFGRTGASPPKAFTSPDAGPPAPNSGGAGLESAAISTPAGPSETHSELGAGGLLALYLLGVLLAAIRPLLGLWGISRLQHLCTDAEDLPTQATAKRCAAILKLRTPRLCRADVSVPMTWGWHRPIVLLPSASVDWSEARLQSVLLHELAHIKRRDWAGHRLADLVCALYWFHPLVWLTARRLRTESELACDDLVLASGISAPDYARHLLEIAAALSPGPHKPHAAIAMAQTSQVEGRITMILDKTRSRRIPARRILLAALILVTAGLALLAVLRPGVKVQRLLSGTSIPFTNASSQNALLFLWPGGSLERTFSTPNGENIMASPDLMTATSLKSRGTTLFAGVTDAGKPGGSWWTVSGAPLPLSPFFNKAAHPMTIVGFLGQRGLLFAFRFPQDAQGITTKFEAPNSEISSSSGQWPGKMKGQENMTEAMLNSETGGVRTLEAVYPASAEKATIRVGIASGPWKVAAFRTVIPSNTFASYSGQNVIVSEPIETAKGHLLTVSTDSENDLRVVAIDSQGHEMLPDSIDGDSVSKLDQITVQFTQPLSQIKEFRVETRPLVWVEYKDVALQPIGNPLSNTHPTVPLTDVVPSQDYSTPWTSQITRSRWQPNTTFHFAIHIAPTVSGISLDRPVTGKLVYGPGQASNFSIKSWKPGRSDILTVKFDYTPVTADKVHPDIIHLLTKQGAIAAVFTYYSI